MRDFEKTRMKHILWLLVMKNQCDLIDNSAFQWEPPMMKGRCSGEGCM